MAPSSPGLMTAEAPGSTCLPFISTLVHLQVWVTYVMVSGAPPVFLMGNAWRWVVPLSILSKLKVVSPISACGSAAAAGAAGEFLSAAFGADSAAPPFDVHG